MVPKNWHFCPAVFRTMDSKSKLPSWVLETHNSKKYHAMSHVFLSTQTKATHFTDHEKGNILGYPGAPDSEGPTGMIIRFHNKTEIDLL